MNVTHAEIISRFADRRGLAVALGVAVCTLGSFRHRDSIPAGYWNRLIAYAMTVGVEVTLSELADGAERRADKAA